MSKHYDRASGYFGSSVYYLIWPGLKEFILNGGKIRLICSPFLSKEDTDSISEGYMNKANLQSSINEMIEELYNSPQNRFALVAMSCMIS